MKTLGLREPQSIEDLLLYRLTRLTAISSAPVLRLMEGRFGISRREWRILAHVAVHGVVSPSNLAVLSNLDRPRASRAIGQLLHKGLIQRELTPGDHRRARVSLTEAGQALYNDVFPVVTQVNCALLEVLDDAQLAQLEQTLQTLTVRAQQVNAQYARDVQANRQGGGSRRIRVSGVLKK